MRIYLTHLLLFITFFTSLTLKGQSLDPNITLKAGVGYFGDIKQFLNPGFGDVPSYIDVNPKVEGKIQHGKAVWLEVSYLLNTGFSAGINYMYGNTSSYYNDGLGIFWDKKQIYTHQLLDISFGKQLNLNRHTVLFSMGMLYRYSFTSFVDYDVWIANNNQPAPVFLTILEIPAHDLGMSFKVDYAFVLKNRILIGVRTNTNLIFAQGFESLSLSPFIGLKF